MREGCQACCFYYFVSLRCVNMLVLVQWEGLRRQCSIKSNKVLCEHLTSYLQLSVQVFLSCVIPEINVTVFEPFFVCYCQRFSVLHFSKVLPQDALNSQFPSLGVEGMRLEHVENRCLSFYSQVLVTFILVHVWVFESSSQPCIYMAILSFQ